MNRQQQIDAFLLAAHRVALSRLREAPGRIVDVRLQLSRWRAQNGRTRSDVYWDEWERLLAMDLAALEAAVCADSEHAAVLRSVSPISSLLTQRERSQLLAQARTA
jgi:hypothetical protein